jgi:hypothetical protein
MLTARRLSTGLAISMIAMGTVLVAPQAASASPGFLYTKYSSTCKKGSAGKSYETSITRYGVGERHIRFSFGVPTGKSTARQLAYNRARVSQVCTKGIGPNLWRWRLDYYGISSGKVSRLKIGKHSCSRAGTCSKAYDITYGAWRAGWTHEKL